MPDNNLRIDALSFGVTAYPRYRCGHTVGLFFATAHFARVDNLDKCWSCRNRDIVAAYERRKAQLSSH